MKTIGILTHPLIGNYGGIIQALAMKETLVDMGYKVIILDRRHNLSLLSQFIKRIGSLMKIRRFANPYSIYNKQLSFIEENFKRTKPLHSHRSLVKAIKVNHIDSVLIGSDQVWNLDYVKNSGLDYWGEFINNSDVEAFSYASSMGEIGWDCTPAVTNKIYRNLMRFKGISVRESKMIDLLESKLRLSHIQHVLDPSLLQTKEFYDNYASPRITESPYIFIYWLGSEQNIPDVSNLYPNHRVIQCKLGKPGENLTVSHWISAIKYADAIVTDSFHGCALSIIFRKHFIPFVNKAGGFSRLQSLFKMLSLEQKLEDRYSNEDYDTVNKKILIQRHVSYKFLKECLD